MLFRNNRCNYKYGLNMTEVLLALCIIGVVAAFTLPSLVKHVPSKEEEVYNKMTYLMGQVVSQLHDDDTMYPKKTDFENAVFENTEKVTVKGVNYEGNTKFCRLFASKFNTVGLANCSANVKTFTSSDGVDWYLPITNFANGYSSITIDVNGEHRGNDCLGVRSAGDKSKFPAKCANGKKADRFLYYVKSNGTVTFDNPAINNATNKKIIVNITSVDRNGNTLESSQGSVRLTDMSGNAIGSAKSAPGENIFDSSLIKKDKNYVLHATPTNSNTYFSSWANNKKIVRVTNRDIHVNVIFTEKLSKAIVIRVNCSGAVGSCISTKRLYHDCYYQKGGISNSDTSYRKEDPNSDFGEYIYMGKGPSPQGYIPATHGSLYKYTCAASPYTFGVDNASKALKITDLYPGEYKIYLYANGTYRFQPGNTTVYEQNIKLGTEDLILDVKLTPSTS